MFVIVLNVSVLHFFAVHRKTLLKKKIYPQEKKSMLFFHAEPLYEHKGALSD